MIYTKKDIIKGAVIYAIGDTIAALLLHEFQLTRLLGMAFVGGTFYAFEIPNYFIWIDKKTDQFKGAKKTIAKTMLAVIHFNPLWVARHLLFIKLFSLNFEAINMNLIHIALWSFVFNVPISILGNYIIQNKIKLDWRFLASSLFSGILAVYYAFSELFFK